VNENTNGLIRQYFPKDSSFEGITDEQVNQQLTDIKKPASF
jgi:IS30 family transposase